MSWRAVAVVGLASLLWTACGVDASSADAGTCPSFFGTRDLPLEAEIGYRATDGGFVALAPGDPLPLVRPVQGGHCVFPAARMRNLCPEDLRLTGTLHDAKEKSLGPYAVNTVGVQIDGWIVPDMELNTSAVPNVCTCPNYWTVSLIGAEIVLELTVTDRVEGRTVTLSTTVAPQCQQPTAECLADCECDCGPDGTAPGACPPLDEGVDCGFE